MEPISRETARSLGLKQYFNRLKTAAELRKFHVYEVDASATGPLALVTDRSAMVLV
jgi:hypothetical protein